MSRRFILPMVGAALCQWSFTPTLPAGAASSAPPAIVSPRDASWMEQLAAREVRRYIYLRTGQRPALVSGVEGLGGRGEAILVARKGRAALDGIRSEASLESALGDLAPQGYCLKTLAPGQWAGGRRALLLVIGGDDAGTLYGAYRFAERLGVRFYLHGDVIPDEQEPWKMPVLDERAAPLFALRGIQPFHDFPEGPDWWNRDDYLAVIGQLPKLRMNFLGLHTYPEDRPNAEPTVWIGLPGDVGQGGKVKFSYPASYQNSLRGNWGYAPRKTGDYLFGSAALFERDAFGPEVMGAWIPAPTTAEADNEVFDRTAGMLREAFGLARKLGVKTCVGTETPLIVPRRVQERIKAQGRRPGDAGVTQELYEGIFQRAAQAYPLDYYWFWTPESWTWSNVKEEQIAETTRDFAAAIAAHKKAGPPFGLATCGWVLGPQQDRAMFDRVLPKEIAVSCINREVGYTPVDAGFAAVKGRSKWAIPWLEDDPALTSPQLWAGRMRRDAADALRYGCDGLMGIHWRTRVLGPNIASLAQAAWDQSPWLGSYKPGAPSAQGPRAGGAEGGAAASLPTTKDFYEDWALHQFGPGAGAAAAIFARMDGNLPKPCTWTDGPGGIKPDARPWEQVRKEYGSVEEFAALRPQVKGPGNLERFDYWLSTFRYFRAIGEMNCAWADYNRVFDKLKKEKDAAAQKQAARQQALPARQKLVGLAGVVFENLLATVSTPGELGTVANWNQHNLPGLLAGPGEELARMLGEPLPAEAQPGKQYQGPMRIIVPALRTSLPAKEALTLKVIILSKDPPRQAALFWRKLGERRFAQIPLQHLQRAVYRVELPAAVSDDFEYYLQAEPEPGQGQAVRFPATAPKLNQTVVISPSEEPQTPGRL